MKLNHLLSTKYIFLVHIYNFDFADFAEPLCLHLYKAVVSTAAHFFINFNLLRKKKTEVAESLLLLIHLPFFTNSKASLKYYFLNLKREAKIQKYRKPLWTNCLSLVRINHTSSVLQTSMTLSMHLNTINIIMLTKKSVHTTPQLHCGADISITSLSQVTAASQHFKLK